MEFIQRGNEVLYVWHGQKVEDLEGHVNELKKIANVKVENAEFGLPQASHAKSSFDVILVNSTTNEIVTDDVLKILLSLVKPKGKVVLSTSEDFQKRLILTGFLNVTFNGTINVCEKANYETGSSVKLNFGKKQQPAQETQKIWKLDMDDDDEMIDADELLDEEDKKKPDDSSLRVCSTTGKRKACKDCSCGLAEELDAEAQGIAVANNPKSSCGSCYLGDAFRCSTCPYLGLPPFKPGEKIQITEMMKSDDLNK